MTFPFTFKKKKKKEGKKKKDIRPRIDQEVVVDNLKERRFFQEPTSYGLKSKTPLHVHTNTTYNLKN